MSRSVSILKNAPEMERFPTWVFQILYLVVANSSEAKDLSVWRKSLSFIVVIDKKDESFFFSN